MPCMACALKQLVGSDCCQRQFVVLVHCSELASLDDASPTAATAAAAADAATGERVDNNDVSDVEPDDDGPSTSTQKISQYRLFCLLC